jgi:hypothetical protein
MSALVVSRHHRIHDSAIASLSKRAAVLKLASKEPAQIINMITATIGVLLKMATVKDETDFKMRRISFDLRIFRFDI